MLSSKADVYVSRYNVAHENRDSIQPQPQSQSTDHKKRSRYEGEQGFAADCIIKLGRAITSYKQKYIGIESSLHVLAVEIALLYGQIDGELRSGWYEGDITPGELFPLHSWSQFWYQSQMCSRRYMISKLRRVLAFRLTNQGAVVSTTIQPIWSVALEIYAYHLLKWKKIATTYRN